MANSNVSLYFRTINGLVGEAKRSIEVVQYVHNSKKVHDYAINGSGSIDYYYKSYFASIEKTIADQRRDVKYTRELFNFQSVATAMWI